MNQYIIPANSKKGKLYFNMFTGFDLGLIGVGGLMTLIFFFTLNNNSIILAITSLLPLGISLLLVMPVANYHNVLTFLKELYAYIVSQKKFRWKGWCIHENRTEHTD